MKSSGRARVRGLGQISAMLVLFVRVATVEKEPQSGNCKKSLGRDFRRKLLIPTG
jgi:hypothetical protein